MKNYAKCLLLLAFVSYEIYIYNASGNVAIRYLHNKILEDTVPEFKEFNTKLRALFVIKNEKQKAIATQDLLTFVNSVISKLNYEIKTMKMTAAQVKAVKLVESIMKRKTSTMK